MSERKINDGKFTKLQEGMFKKGGVNNPPSTPRPSVPQAMTPKPSTPAPPPTSNNPQK